MCELLCLHRYDLDLNVRYLSHDFFISIYNVGNAKYEVLLLLFYVLNKELRIFAAGVT